MLLLSITCISLRMPAGGTVVSVFNLLTGASGGFCFQNFTSSQSRYWPKIASQCFISMRLPNSSICKGAKYHHVKFNLDAENRPCKQKLAEKQRCKKMPSPFSSKPVGKFIQQKQKSMRPPNSDGSRWRGSFTDLLVEEINAQKSVPKRHPCKTSFQPDTADLNMAARFHPSCCQQSKKDGDFHKDFDAWEAIWLYFEN